MELLQFAHYRSPCFEFLSIPLIITGILFLVMEGLGRTGVSGGCSEEPVFCRVGSVGELVALRFLRLRLTSVNSSSWLTDCII